MKKYKAHPAADLFPMMGDAELRELAADIKARGQLQPIILTSENLVLDGRNRLAACELAGVEPEILMWDREDDDMSPTAWVLSQNLHRRHLNESQRALIGAKAAKMYEAEARKRQKTGGSSPKGDKGRSSEKAAAATASKPRTVQRAQALLKNASKEDIAAIERGEKTIGRVEKELKREEQREQIRAYVPPEGKFQVITTDFSWEYNDKLDGSDAVRGGPPYPPQTTAQIVDFIKTKLAPCCDDVCLYGCWVTNTILLDLETWPAVQAAIEALGFRPVKLNTWRKVEKSGAPHTGLGNGQRNDTEQLVLFARGQVIYNELGEEHGRPLQRTCFDAPIGEHSEKPQLAYDRLEQLVPYTRRLEMFARKARPGWTGSGSELKQEPPAIAEPVGIGAELARKDAGGVLAILRYPLPWPKNRLANERPSCKGPSGCTYTVYAHSQGLPLNTVVQTLPDGKRGSVADLTSISQCEARAEEWEQLQLERAERAPAAKQPMFIETPAGQRVVDAINEGMEKSAQVVKVGAEDLGDLTGTPFGEQLAKHAAKKKRQPADEPDLDAPLPDWVQVGDRFERIIEGTKYTVRKEDERDFWQFERKGFAGGGFMKASFAMREAEQHEADLEPEPEIEQCEAQDGKPGPKNGSCILGKGHEGAHSNGRRTWPNKKRKIHIEDCKGCPECTPKSDCGIEWAPITKKTVVPGLEIEKGKKYFVSRGELGTGKRTLYLLEPATEGRYAGLGIVSEDLKGVCWPGAFKTTDNARAAADEYERTGELPQSDFEKDRDAANADEKARAEVIPYDAIAWVAKKHPVKVAVGVAPSGRRYAIDRFKPVKEDGRKLGVAFRWFCTSNGSSSLQDFPDIDRAKANAGHHEQQLEKAAAA